MEDPHPHHQVSGSATSGIAERGDVLTRQPLERTEASECESDQQGQRVDGVDLASVLPRDVVEEKTLPLLEVTWPIRWK
jgi:hypothetical protein